MLVSRTSPRSALRCALLGASVAACSPSLGGYISASQGTSSAAEGSAGATTAVDLTDGDVTGTDTDTTTSGSSTSGSSTSSTSEASTTDASSSTSTGGAPLCPDCDLLCTGLCEEVGPIVAPCEACQDCVACGECPDCPTCMDCVGDECGVNLLVCIHGLACEALTQSYDAEIAGQAAQDFGASLRCVACHLGSIPACAAEEADCRADATCDARRQCVDGCSCLDDAARARCVDACPDPDDRLWFAWTECEMT